MGRVVETLLVLSMTALHLSVVPGIILCIVGIWIKTCLYSGCAVLGLDLILSDVYKRQNLGSSVRMRVEKVSFFSSSPR